MSWPLRPLRECCELIAKGTTPTTLKLSFVENGIPFLRVQDITDGTVRPGKSSLFIDEATHTTLRRSQIRAGDVLVSIAGTIGRVGVVPHDAPAMNCNQAIAIIRSNGAILPQFLRHWLETPHAQGRMRGAAVTGTISNLSLTQLGNLPVSLPPLSEQRRISAILDRCTATMTRRQATLAQVDDLPDSIFRDLFETGNQPAVTIGEANRAHVRGWPLELLTDVARLATGHTPDRRRPAYWNGDVPWITLADIRRLDGTIAQGTAEMITQAGVDHSAAVRLPVGTVCFSRTASIGFVTIMGREMTTSQDFVNWVCGPRLRAMCLMHALIHSRTRLRALSTGSTHKTIYFPTVEQFRVLIPPIELQQEFDHRIGIVDRLRRVLGQSLMSMDALRATLQHRAFNGEL